MKVKNNVKSEIEFSFNQPLVIKNQLKIGK